jgi:two-component sensor histidine kinase
MDIEDFSVDVRKLSSLGIIINELITNMMKHAFVGRDSGVISVTASLKGACATIVLQDDGIGMPDGIGPKASAGFGLQLVDMLIEQMGSSMRMERSNGTRIVLECAVS